MNPMMLTEQQKQAFHNLLMNGGPSYPMGGNMNTAAISNNFVPQPQMAQGLELDLTDNNISGYSLTNGYHQPADLCYLNGFSNDQPSLYTAEDPFVNPNQVNFVEQMFNGLNIPALPTVPAIPTDPAIDNGLIDPELQSMYAPYFSSSNVFVKY